MKIGRLIIGIICVALAVLLFAAAQPVWLGLVIAAVGVCMVITAVAARSSERTPLLKIPAVQTILSSLLCIILGLLIGYIVLLLINPAGAWQALSTIMQNFMSFRREATQIKNLGNTLVKTIPLLLCSLSVLFAYKVGLFNIGAAGQYVAGVGASLYCAIALGLPWFVCVAAAIVAGALLGAISGLLKATRNVNEVISGIMLNWICLYLVNMLLVPCMDTNKAESFSIKRACPQALLPTLGINSLFNNHDSITIAVPIGILIAVLIWYIMAKTKLGYELRATGLNKNAAKYAGMKERFNIILTMAISGGLAGLGAALFYLTDMPRWPAAVAAVPAMGFNGIAAAFLGGLHPIGAIFSSFFIQHITDGGSFMDKAYPAEIAGLVSSVVIYMCAFVLYFRQSMTASVDRRIERRHNKLVKDVRGILKGEANDDLKAIVAAEVERECQSAAVTVPALPAAETRALPPATEAPAPAVNLVKAAEPELPETPAPAVNLTKAAEPELPEAPANEPEPEDIPEPEETPANEPEEEPFEEEDLPEVVVAHTPEKPEKKDKKSKESKKDKKDKKDKESKKDKEKKDKKAKKGGKDK